MRVAILLLAALPLLGARGFTGASSQALQSSANIDLSGYTSVTVAAWINVSTQSMTWEFTANANTTAGGFWFYLPTAQLNAMVRGNVGNCGTRYGTMATSTWTHILVNYDYTRDCVNGGERETRLWVNGVEDTTIALFESNINNTSTGFNSAGRLNVFSRATTSLYQSGSVEHVYLIAGQPTQAQINAIYRGEPSGLAACGTPPCILRYWPIAGVESPEPGSIGSLALSMNLTNAPPNAQGAPVAPAHGWRAMLWRWFLPLPAAYWGVR